MTERSRWDLDAAKGPDGGGQAQRDGGEGDALAAPSCGLGAHGHAALRRRLGTHRRGGERRGLCFSKSKLEQILFELYFFLLSNYFEEYFLIFS